jgi:sugar phosphate isomerase/epimerase
MKSPAGSDRVCLFSACLPGWTARRVVEAAVSLGFSTIEWASGPGHAIEDPATASEVRQLCERAGLASGGVAVQDPAVTLATPKAAAAHVALAAALEAPHVRLLPPAYRGGSLRRERQRAVAGVDLIVELAAPAGLAVLVETSPSTLAPGPDLAAELVEHHPPERAGVLYDPGNMLIEGHLAPTLAIARLGRYLRHVHVKNIGWARRGEAWQWRRARLAAGILDWRSIVHGLAAARYEGLMSIDHLGGVVSKARLDSESTFLRGLVTEEFSPASDGGGSRAGTGTGSSATTAAGGGRPKSPVRA